MSQMNPKEFVHNTEYSVSLASLTTLHSRSVPLNPYIDTMESMHLYTYGSLDVI